MALVDEVAVLTCARLYVKKWAIPKLSNIAMFDTFYLDYIRDIRVYNNAHKPIKGVSKLELEAAYNEFLLEVPVIKRKALEEKIIGYKENLEPIKTWIKAVTGSLEDDNLYVMCHWLWAVKRNLLNLPVVWHIMPIVTSPKQGIKQGGGKSTAVRKIITPISDLMLELQMPQIVDERSFTLFSNYLIGFLDEMAGADKVDVEAFKRNVTSSTLTYRPMRTNTQIKITNLCSFIGASNNEIYEIIRDTSGVRRFFPIYSLELIDQATINDINYLELWRGIDETIERGYFERVQKQVVEKQIELAMKDEVLIFVEDYSLKGKDTVAVNGKMLYMEYDKQARDSGITFREKRQTFYKKLKNMGITSIQRRDDANVLTWFFGINKESPMAKKINQ